MCIMNSKIIAQIENFDAAVINEARREILKPLVDFIQNKIRDKQEIRLNFICTHNSRRSHFSQVWAQSLAHYFKIKNVYCYSGGTESTFLYPTVVETLQNSGFQIKKISNEENPIYSIKYAENEHPIIGFSKIYNDDFNPRSGFAAVLTCSQAAEECPLVLGAEKRISIAYNDPKEYDGTAKEKEKYSETNNQIATELFYVFSQIQVL